jgi:hypothetical protein
MTTPVSSVVEQGSQSPKLWFNSTTGKKAGSIPARLLSSGEEGVGFESR